MGKKTKKVISRSNEKIITLFIVIILIIVIFLNFFLDSGNNNVEVNEEFEETIEIINIGPISGIGIDFFTTNVKEDTFVHKVKKVYPNSQAWKAGIKDNDIIIKLNGINVTSKNGNELKSFITDANFKSHGIEIIVDRGDKKGLILVTQEYSNSVIDKVFVKNEVKIGYLGVTTFDFNTHSMFAEKLVSIEKKGITSLIIDVRDNGFGDFVITDGILKLFTEEGDVFYLLDTGEGNRLARVDTGYKYFYEYDDAFNPRVYPIVILINENSVGAAELLAASMSEVYKAKLVGIKTTGDGIYHSSGVFSKRWLTPQDVWTGKTGVVPDIEIKQNDAYYIEPNDVNDSQLQKALDLLVN